jgi:hypothetical protein
MLIISTTAHAYAPDLRSFGSPWRVCVLLFCQKTEELHTPAHPCKC